MSARLGPRPTLDMKQRAEITFETEETIVLREGSRVQTEFCSGCGESVLMAPPQTTAALSNLTEREIFRLVEGNKIHFSESGHILICLRSITELLKELDSTANK